MRQRVFFKLLAAMVLVVLAAAAMLDISQQNILESSLQNQLVRSLTESAQALAQRVVISPAANLWFAGAGGSARRRCACHHPE